jgi:hypothetical protein
MVNSPFRLTGMAILVSYLPWMPRRVGFPATVESSRPGRSLIGAAPEWDRAKAAHRQLSRSLN